MDYICNKYLQIQIALLFKILYAQIKEILDIIDNQIYYIKNHCLILQKTRAGRQAKLYTPKKITFKE
jgi:hypothetical protein